MESKKVKYTEAQSSMVVTRNGEVGELGRCSSKGTKSQLSRLSMSRELMYSRMATVINTVMYTRNLLRQYISGAPTTHKNKW